MSRPIDANDCEKYWCENCINFDREHIGMDATAVCALTKQLQYAQNYGAECPYFNGPAADVQEVRHGKWVYHYRLKKFVCLECGFEARHKPEFKFCPACGAKMDGGEDNA